MKSEKGSDGGGSSRCGPFFAKKWENCTVIACSCRACVSKKKCKRGEEGGEYSRWVGGGRAGGLLNP